MYQYVHAVQTLLIYKLVKHENYIQTLYYSHTFTNVHFFECLFCFYIISTEHIFYLYMYKKWA